MKNLYTLVLIFFCTWASSAQIVNIPDPHFKTRLINMGVDLDNDQEIQVSEALAVTVLDLSGITNNLYISDLTGIEAFTNLSELVCTYNNISSINLSTLTSLTRLSVDMNELTSIDVTGLTNLTFLDCRYNEITELDVSNNIHLKSLWCNYNLLTSLDVLNLVDLEDFECSENLLTALNTSTLSHVNNLHCSNNQLTSLDLTGMTSLVNLACSQNNLTDLNVAGLSGIKYLNCSDNQLAHLNIANLTDLRNLITSGNLLTNLDFTTLTKLKYVDVTNNLFTALDFSALVYYPTSWPPQQYKVGGNPNLTYLNLKNGIPLGLMYGGHHTWSSFNATGSNNLVYICADEFNFSFIDTAPNAQVNSYCTFTPGGNYNTITGTFSLDNDNNGCDANDFHIPNNKIELVDGTAQGATFTNTSGNYNFFTQAGSFVVTPEFENPYFTLDPSSATITFADGNNHTQTQNFCLTPNGSHKDVEIKLIPQTLPRPGFDTLFRLVYKNKGNQLLSGNIVFNYDDGVLDYVSSNVAVSGQTLNQLTWDYSDLSPFETRTIDLTLNVNSPQEIPPTNAGDFLDYSATISPISGDETPSDNNFALRQTIVNSIDPNDKTCLQGDTIAPEKVGDYLDYVIRFENSGTAAAQNVVVKDIIDTNKFDLASLQLTTSSHPHTTRINGNKVEFIFENINLPAGIINEPESHGFVAFKIKTKNDLALGNTIANTADIYFDYNWPVATNTATTTVAILSKDTFEDHSVSIAPNPAKDKIQVAANDNITSIQLFDVQGRLIETIRENNQNVTFDLSKNATGIYFLKVYTAQGVKVQKIIKE